MQIQEQKIKSPPCRLPLAGCSTDIDQGKTLVWRNGVVLRWPGEALAEVSKTKLQGRDAFYIRSQGRDRKGLLTVILKTFRDLHAEYRGIRWEEKVPCPCAGCREGTNKQHYFDFENLKNRLEKGRRQVECDKSLEELELLSLLENHFVFEQLKTGQPLLLKQDIGGNQPSEPRIRRNIFLASSAELKPERERIEIEVNRLNKQLLDRGVFLFLSLWEDAQNVGQSFRSQDDYNQEVEACDIFVLLFHSKLGKYTREEFQLAQKRLATTGAPRMLIFQKDVDLPKNQSREDANSRLDFLDELRQADHFPILFENTDALLRQLVGILREA